jgi:histone H3/H4
MPDADEPKSLPLANIKRIIADNLPRDVKPHKDVVSMLQESTTSLIGLVVCEALDRTDLDGRRTISGDDCTF